MWFHSYNQGGASTADVAGEGGIRGGTAAWYLRDCKGLTPGLHLAFYLRMLRNVLAHEEAALQPQPYLSASSTQFRSAVNHVASFPFAEAFADVYIMFKPLLTEFADGR